MTDDERYRHEKMESGARFQDHVVERLLRRRDIVIMLFSSRENQYRKGESLNGVEIKHDEKYRSTGNLWIEVGEKAMPRAGDFMPSGILRPDNTWLYVIGDYQTLFLFAKRTLVQIWESGKFRVIENDRKTSQGFLLPDATARKWAALIEESDLKPVAPAVAVPSADPVGPLTAGDIRWGGGA